MFDLFGFKKRKKAREEERAKEKERIYAENLALAEEKKAKYQERKYKINAYLAEYDQKMRDAAFLEYKKRLEDAAKENTTCPHCGSRNVVNKIIRTKGELHGKGSSVSHSYSDSTFGILGSSHYSHSYSYGNSKVDGNLDTYPVNRCKDCEHEWYVKYVDVVGAQDDFSTYASCCPSQLFYEIKNFLKLEYDPLDVREECNSLEEKQNNLIEITSVSHRFDSYRNAPRYMVEYALYMGITDHFYHARDLDKLFNFSDSDDKYSYTMSDELWEITKKIIGWKEPTNL